LSLLFQQEEELTIPELEGVKHSIDKQAGKAGPTGIDRGPHLGDLVVDVRINFCDSGKLVG